MKKLAIVFVLAISIINIGCKNEVDGEIKVISTSEMQSLLKMDEVQLVDVRTPEEVDEGYIENAQNIDYNSSTFDEDILKLDKDKPVVLYCHSGRRSADCANKLKLAGFKKIYDLEGGISQWKHEGLPVVE